MTALVRTGTGAFQVTVDWRAFLGAAVVAPVCLALMGVIGLHYGLMLSVITAVVSLPGYVFLGLPAAYICIRYFPDENGELCYGKILIASFIADSLVVPLGGLAWMVWYGDFEAIVFTGAAQYAAIGIVVAPLLAAIFAALYRRFARPARPVTDANLFT